MAEKITMTEALAKLKIIDKKVQSNIEFIQTYVARLEKVKDPLSGEGGSEEIVKQKRQSTEDLLMLWETIRISIQKKNLESEITISGTTKTVAGWLVWRREVADRHKKSLKVIQKSIHNLRDQARRKDVSFVEPGSGKKAEPDDIIVVVKEKELADNIDAVEETLGELDGRLSLFNATTHVEI